MATFKKKDIKKINIDELVNDDGSFIDGDESNQTTSQISTGDKPVDTDRYVVGAKRHMRYPYGYMGTAYSHGDRSATFVENEEELDEQTKMKNLVEDIIAKRFKEKDVLAKKNVQDINRNNIPDLDDLSNNNKQNVAYAVKNLVKNITSVDLSGEEKAIILNYVIQNIEAEDIPINYIKLIKNIL